MILYISVWTFRVLQPYYLSIVFTKLEKPPLIGMSQFHLLPRSHKYSTQHIINTIYKILGILSRCRPKKSRRINPNKVCQAWCHKKLKSIHSRPYISIPLGSHVYRSGKKNSLSFLIFHVWGNHQNFIPLVIRTCSTWVTWTPWVTFSPREILYHSPLSISLFLWAYLLSSHTINTRKENRKRHMTSTVCHNSKVMKKLKLLWSYILSLIVVSWLTNNEKNNLLYVYYFITIWFYTIFVTNKDHP